MRSLEREIGRLLRKVAAGRGDARAGDDATTDGRRSWSTTPWCARTSAGPASRPRRSPTAPKSPGVATGLAVTGTGGDVLFVEATALDGEPGLQLTGQLGDVMKESAQIALTYVTAHADELGVDAERLGSRRFHVHVPAGAVPKDGPSAGVTMTTAIVSLLTQRPVRGDVGMTGEVTLQGRVLPIGGVKQKVLAAERAGLTTVILPGPQRARPRRRARGGAGADDVPPRRGRRPGPRLGPRTRSTTVRS